MTSLGNRIRRFFSPAQPLTPGMYTYQSQPDDPTPYRLHLRIEQDGSGVLIVNAATVLHLNQTAAEYAYYLVRNQPAQKVARQVAARYHVDLGQAEQDYRDFSAQIQNLVNTPDLDPVTFLGFDRRTPLKGHISAPYRLDCALTYRLPAGEAPEVAPLERVKRELSTAEWQAIIDKAWQAGIPHIVFTGGEPTLRDDLPSLIAYAEQRGLVTGLLSDGVRLADHAYFDRLLQAGLDHLMLEAHPNLEPLWASLQEVIPADLFTAVHLTLSPEQDSLEAQIDRLAEMGVRAISMTASSPNLQPNLEAARQRAADRDMELVWNLPVPYSSIHPVALEVPDKEEAAGPGRAWLYVEPDGDVLPGQGINRVLGNLIADPWEKIWKH